MSKLKQFIKKSLNLFNLEIISKKNFSQINDHLSRMTMEGCLIQASLNGIKPATVIDVGAAKSFIFMQLKNKERSKTRK